MPISAEQWRVSVGQGNASRSLRPHVTSQSKRKLTPWDILVFFFTALLGAILFPSMMPVSTKKWCVSVGSQHLQPCGTTQLTRKLRSWDTVFSTLLEYIVMDKNHRMKTGLWKCVSRGSGGGTVGELTPSLLTAPCRKELLMLAGDVESNPGPLTDQPTLLECIRFKGRKRRINIPEEIGVKFRIFGLLLLEDHNGARIRALALKHMNDALEINIEIIEEWVCGRGKHPVTWKTLTEVLRDIELNTLAGEIEAVKLVPEEVDSQQILEEALEKGYVECYIWKVLVTGAAGSGKTCLKHRLLGEEPPSIRCSTALAEAAIRAISHEIVGTDKTGWFRVTYDELMEMLGGALKEGVPMERSRVLPSGTPELHVGSFSLPYTEIYATSPNITTPSVSVKVSSSKQELVQLIEKSQGSKRFLQVQWIHFIDSGGQPQFHEVLPAFIRNTTATIFVMKLSERLDEHPVIKYYDRNGQICGKPFHHALSNEQMLQCCARTILSREGKHSKTLIVGTHRDQESSFSESREEKNRKLIDMLVPSLQDKLVYYHLGTEVIFPINAKTPNEQDHQVCAEIRKQIEDKEDAPPPYKIPIGWFLLERDIINSAKGGVISKKWCLSIATLLNMNAEALKAALEYFDNLNIFLYYPSILSEVVFSNPQILLNKVTELVHFSYSLQSDSPPVAVEGKWLHFRDKGIVRREMFRDQRFSAHYIPDLFTPADLMKLLQHLLIIAPLSSIEYFMPSLLQMISPEQVDKQLPSPSTSVAPLLVHFPAGCAQNGVFCALVVYLISVSGWKFAKGTIHCVSRNCVCFQLPGKPGCITLVDSFTFFELHVKAPNSMYPELCPMIRVAIFSGLKAAAKSLRYNNSTPLPAFFCKCSSPPHAATIDDKGCYLICTTSTNFTSLTKQHEVWLDLKLPRPPDDEGNKITTETLHNECHTAEDTNSAAQLTSSFPTSSTLASSGSETGAVSAPQTCSPHSPQTLATCKDDTLSEKDLLDITDYLLDMDKSHIYNLGLVLGLRQTKVKALMDSHTFLDDVITAWLRKEDQVSEKGQPSWTVLVNALKHRRVGQTGIANNIAKDHLEYI